MSRIALLYNRKSGRQSPHAHLAEAIALFEASGADVITKSIDFESDPFEGLGRFELLVVAGGDGTIGFVVDRMLHCGIDTPLGIIPLGTANDFARMLGFSLNPLKAARQILNGKVRNIDCGRVNGRHFANVFSFGLFTTTSQHTADAPKRIWGRLAYLIEGLRELRTFRAIPLTVRSEEVEFSAEVVIALVFNGRTAGHLPLARKSRPDDGMLDALFVTKRPLPLLLFDALRHICGGKPASFRSLRSQHIQLTSSLTDITTDMDGQSGPEFPLDITCLKGRLKICG